MTVRVAVDIGGTFTDLTYLDEATGWLAFAKVPSTPSAFEAGVVEALKSASITPEDVSFFVHGTTVVINAITERRGAKTGLLTTRGMRDVLEIARGNRPDIYNLRYRKPAPFVPRYLRLEAIQRMDAGGRVVEPLNENEVRSAAQLFAREGVEAVAICFLHGYANPRHEERAGELIREVLPAGFISLSHEVTREFREYERTNTTVLNAYVGPACESYLDRLRTKLTATNIPVTPFVMSSNGGISTIGRAQRLPINLIESGPAAGVTGAANLGRELGIENLISFDVGGTTAKCSLVDHQTVNVVTEYHVERTATSAGYPVKAPVVDILEIGAGGGSIAWRDSDGAVRVGPRSAGADPGPAAYGREGGVHPTVTDAQLIAGRIDPHYFLGGQMVLRPDRARQAYAPMAQDLGMSIDETAQGILRIAAGNMINAVKIISVQRGHDPRNFALVAIGGGGPLHAGYLARELHVPTIVVPVAPAHFSASAMLGLDLRRDYIQTAVMTIDGSAPQRLGEIYGELETRARKDHDRESTASRLRLAREADVRYRGQEHTVHIEVGSGPIDETSLHAMETAFHDAHYRKFSFRLESRVEVVNVRLVAWGILPKPEKAPLQHGAGPSGATSSRAVWFEDDGLLQAPVFRRERLGLDSKITGPAIVEEPATVTLVYPEMKLSVHEMGELIIESKP